MAAYLLDPTDRVLIWLIAGFASFEAIAEGLAALLRNESMAAITWFGASGAMFVLAAVIQTIKSRRGPS